MKRFGWLAVALACAGPAAWARDTAQDEHFILRAEAVICSAYEEGDADSLRNKLDDGFTLTDSKGTVTTRDQELASVAHRDPAYLVFKNHGQKVRVYGDAAVVTGITTLQGHTAGGTFAGDYAYTDTWVYRDGHWMLAASHASLLKAR